MVGKKDFEDLRKELKRQGFEVRQNKNRHYAVYKNGAWVCGLPSGGSNRHALANQIAALRRAGFIWNGR